MGGPSSEHEVSLKSGRAVLEKSDKEKYELVPIVISKKLEWEFPVGLIVDEATGLAQLKKHGIDVVFIALHGEYGEDGTIQEALERLNIPFTGSRTYASAMGINKAASAEVFTAHGLMVPRFIVVTPLWTIAKIKQVLMEQKLKAPLVVKPLNLGSSIGVQIVRRAQDLEETIKKTFQKTRAIIVQEYIAGREVTCGVIGEAIGARALPPTEIIPQASAFFDYEAKYQPGASKETTPPEIPEETIAHIQACALAAHALLRCSGVSRTDMILHENGDLFVLELNTLPGLTETSLIPQEAEAIGINFTSLIDILIESSLTKKKPV